MAASRHAVGAILLGAILLGALQGAPLAAQATRSAAPPDGAASPPAPTRVGPPRGTVIVVGGGAMGPEIYSQLIEASGGPDALIVDVPNAGGPDACAHVANDAQHADDAPGARLLRAAGARNVRVLCTTDRAVANSDAFVATLAHAGGVWFEGGRQFRLVDAYAGTKTEQAFHDVLARGGAVGGSSAGASILGDFLVRGAPSNDNSIMDFPAYEKGFAFLRGVAIDQHVVARERLPDLADSIIARRPELLGISEDEGTAWVVRGDTATIIGRNKAFVYGGRDPNDPGKPFLTLHPGDRYDLATRHVIHRAIQDSPLTTAFIDRLFARFARPGGGGATVLVAQNGEVYVDTSYGVPPQPRYMPTTTVPQFPLGLMSGIFTALCAQVPAPTPAAGASDSTAAAARVGTSRMTPFQQCMARTVATPIGMHRTTATADGEVLSDVDELYRLELGLENPRTWPDADRSRGWVAETQGGVNTLAAYAAPDGRRGAFVRIPGKHAVVIVLTSDDATNARAIAGEIAARLK
jgi:cyanophycinase